MPVGLMPIGNEVSPPVESPILRGGGVGDRSLLAAGGVRAQSRLDTGRDLVLGLMPALAPTSRRATSFMVTEGVLLCSDTFWEWLRAAYLTQSASCEELASASRR